MEIDDAVSFHHQRLLRAAFAPAVARKLPDLLCVCRDDLASRGSRLLRGHFRPHPWWGSAHGIDVRSSRGGREICFEVKKFGVCTG